MKIKNETEIQLMKILFKTNKKKPTKNITSQRAYPHGVEAKYYRQLKGYFKPLTDYVIKYINENMEPLLRGDAANIKLDAIPGNAFRDMLNNLENWLSIYMPDISEIPEPKNNNVIFLGLGKTADEAYNFAAKDFDKIIEKGIHVNPPISATWWNDMKNSWAEDNYTLITSNAKNYVSKINTLTEQAIVNGLSPMKLKEQIMKATDSLSDAHCKLLARDQMGKLNGQITQAQMEEIGLELYIWSTAYDDRVRESHAIMEGLLCRWDDASVCSYDNGKTWEPRPSGAVELHPGQDIQCRCVGLAFYPELISEVENKSLDEVFAEQDFITSELKENMIADLTDEEKALYNEVYDRLKEFDGNKNNAIEISYACASGDFTKVPDSVFRMSETNWLNLENKIKRAMELYDSKNMVINEFEIARDLFQNGKKLPKFTCTQNEFNKYIAYLKSGGMLNSYDAMFAGKYNYEKYLAFAKKLGYSDAGLNTYYRGLLGYMNMSTKELEKKSFLQFIQTNTQFTFSEIKNIKYFDECLQRANISIGNFNIYDFTNIEAREGIAWGTAELNNPNFKAIAMFDHEITYFDKTTQKLITVNKVAIDSRVASQGIAQKLYCEKFYSETKKLSPLKIKYAGKTYKYHNDEFLRLEFSYDGKKKNYKVGQILKQTGVFATTPSELHNAIWYKGKIQRGAQYPVRFHLKRNKLAHKYLSSVQIDDLGRGVYTNNNPEEFDFSIGKVKVKKIYKGYINGDKTMPVLEIDVEIVE